MSLTMSTKSLLRVVTSQLQNDFLLDCCLPFICLLGRTKSNVESGVQGCSDLISPPNCSKYPWTFAVNHSGDHE